MAQERRNASYAAFEIFFQVVLPQTDDSPAAPAKLPKIAGIALSISFDLGFPERLEPPRPRRKSIPMPKVPIYEDRDFSAGEDYVRTARKGLKMLSEANAAPMERRPNQTFQIGVFLSHPRH